MANISRRSPIAVLYHACWHVYVLYGACVAVDISESALRASFNSSNRFGFPEQVLRHPDTRDVDEPPVQLHRASSFARGLFHGGHDAPCTPDFFGRRTEDLICERDLRRMDRPFSF